MSKEVKNGSEQALVPIEQAYGTVIQCEEDVDPNDIVLLASVRIRRRAQESYSAEQARAEALQHGKSAKQSDSFESATAEFIHDPKTFAELAVAYICEHRDEIKRDVTKHFQGMNISPTMDEIIKFIVDKRIFPEIAPNITLSTNGKILATDPSTLSELGTFIHGPFRKFLEKLMGHYCQTSQGHNHCHHYKPIGSPESNGLQQYGEHELNRRASNQSGSNQLQIFIDFIFQECVYRSYHGGVLTAPFLYEYPERGKSIAISEFLEKLQIHLRKILHTFSDPSETYATAGSQIYSQTAAEYSGGAETIAKRSPIKNLDAILDVMVCRLMHLECPEVFHKTAGGDISKKRADFEKRVDEFINTPERTPRTELVDALTNNREQIIIDLRKLQEDYRLQSISPDEAAEFIANNTLRAFLKDVVMVNVEDRKQEFLSGLAGEVEEFNPLEDPNKMIDLMICDLMRIGPGCIYQTKPTIPIPSPDQREENNICLADIERYDRFLEALRIQMKLIAIREQIRRPDLGLTEDGKTDSSEPEIEHRFFRDMAIHSVGTEILDFIDQLPSKEDLSRLDNLPRIWYPLCGISRQELKRLKKLKDGMMTTLEELESEEVPNILGLYKVMMAAYKYYEVGKRLFQKYEGQERMAGEMYMEIGRIIAERAKMAARTTDSAIEIDKANLEDEGDNLIGLLHVPDEKELQRSLMGHMVSLNAMFSGIARVRRESAALNTKIAGELPPEE